MTVLVMTMLTMGAMAQPPHGGRDHGDRPGERNRHEFREGDRGRHDKHFECATREQLSISLQTIENQSFDDKKLEIAKLCVTLCHFCTRDLELMARQFSFDENRKKFLTYAYRYVTDPQNYYSLRDAFEFRTNFDDMMEKIAK